jgi:putative nucleotidyltransferase with HDIG domain
MTQNVHHKEDVFGHILTVLQGTNPDLVTRLIALFHDIGKVVTRSETPTGVHFYGHEDVGADVAEKIMRDLKYPTELVDAVKLGVRNHMRLKSGGDEANLTDKTLRKFKIALGDQLEQVLDVIHADNVAHADASAMPNQVEKVRQRLKTLDVQVKKPTCIRRKKT